MTTNRPRVHTWFDIPADCRIESTVLNENETRMVLGDPAEDGHTLEMTREALRRLHKISGVTLDAMDNGNWEVEPMWISDPTSTASAWQATTTGSAGSAAGGALSPSVR